MKPLELCMTKILKYGERKWMTLEQITLKALMDIIIKSEKAFQLLHNLIARVAMDKEKVLHEIKRDLKSPMVFRGLVIIANIFLILIYHIFLS